MTGPEPGLTGGPKKLGEVLISRGKISGADLEEALEVQRVRGGYLGNILVSLGRVSSEDLARALSAQLGVRYVDLSREEVEPEALRIVSEEVLLRHNAVPLRMQDGRLIVAMRDPNDLYARSELAVSAGHPVVPVIASEDGIWEAQRRLFGRSGEGVSGAVEPVEPPQRSAVVEQNGTYSVVRWGAGGVPGGEKIGEILVADGVISEEQLRHALDIQRGDPRDLGQILLSLAFVTADDLARALARRFRLDYVKLSELGPDDVNPEALDLIDGATLRKYRALPLRFEDDGLVVAMSDPNDLYALEDLRMLARRRIKPVVTTEEDLNGAFAQLFGDQEEDGAAGPAEAGSGDGAVDEAAEEARGAPRPEATEARRRVGTVGGRIGEILVSEGRISPEQLDEALAIQKDDRREIGQVLLSLGYVSRADLARALALRLRLEYVELTDTDVDRAVVGLVDPKVLRRHDVMPLRIEDGRLVLAMSDPKNFYAIEDVMVVSGYPVTPVVALEEDIRRVQNKALAVGGEVTELLQEAAGEDVGEVGEVELGMEADAENAPIVRLVSSILQQAVGDGASDIHVEPRARELTVRFRVDGVLREVMSVPPKLQSGVIARLKILANLNIAERRVPQDGRFSVRLGSQKIDLRAASLPTVYGEKIVLRLLDTANVEVDLTRLGLEPGVLRRYEGVFRRPYGTILVTGPTGSGKSTTLYATLNELNSPETNIITVEDPVEYRMRGINQIQVNPQVGLTFASGLRSILRADPDVVMIGEIRDYETAKISVEAALTGHLVLATLHTNNAPAAVTRLTDMGVEPFLTSSAVDCVIAQRLARRLCERCRRPAQVDRETLEALRFPFEHFSGEPDFYEAVGCERCGGTGYRGRIGVYEMMILDEGIRELVLRRASAEEVGRAAEKRGMIRLRQDGLMKAARGVTTIEEVLRTVV